MDSALVQVTGFLFATAILAGVLFIYLLGRNLDSRSATFMAFLMGASSLWAALNGFEYLASRLEAKLLLANLQYLAIAAIPVIWYSFGRSYDLEERTGTGSNPKILVWIIPVITAVLVWLDPSLGLVRTNFRLEKTGGFIMIAKDFGPWFWFHSLYSYVFIIAGTVFILRGAGARGWTGRMQQAMLLGGALLPTGANLVYILGLFPVPTVDPTPLAFSITGVLLVVNLTRFRFLSLVSVARAEAMENLPDALLIFDRHSALAYANKAAKSALEIPALAVGEKISRLGPVIASLVDLVAGEEREIAAAPSSSNPESRSFVAHASVIFRGKRPAGRVLVLHDVTRRAAAEKSLKVLNQELEERIAERTRTLEDTNIRLTRELDHRARAERQLTHSALHDPLTGLPNRSLLLSRIEQSIARFRRDPADVYGLLYVDFDGFKEINDIHGHDAGDTFLCEVANRLKGCMRDVDTVARLGGDEFAVLLDGLHSASEVALAAERVAEEISVPIKLGGGSVVPSASIGILSGRPELLDAQEALRNADIAMYWAKTEGRNRSICFEEDMLVQVVERNRLTNDLRAAIGASGISLAFQPIVHLDGNPAGWEVLARWRHPELGQISPDRFIHIAEESGLIVPLGTFVLLETLKTIVALRDFSFLVPDGEGILPFFAVNVSAVQLAKPDFADLVLASLERFSLPRSVLHLEITESAIIQNRDAAIAMLGRLSSEGISVKLDDFGTGYSSLGYLDRIPVDTVKVDRSFIIRMDSVDPKVPNSSSIVKGIISLSHELGKTVVAEGVETAEQVSTLQGFGCEYAQGYYFGKPMDAGALMDSLRTPAVTS
jgi:diguanylate cyclase (GGDEF)-like protein